MADCSELGVKASEEAAGANSGCNSDVCESAGNPCSKASADGMGTGGIGRGVIRRGD